MSRCIFYNHGNYQGYFIYDFEEGEEPQFTLKEKEFISSLILGLDFENLSGYDYYLIVDRVGTEYGFVCEDEPIQDLEKCFLCESILDKLRVDEPWHIAEEEYEDKEE